MSGIDKATCCKIVLRIDKNEPVKTGWSSDTVNDPGYRHQRATKLWYDVQQAGDDATTILIDALLNDQDVTVRESAANLLMHREFSDTVLITDTLIMSLQNKNERAFVLETVADALGYHDVKKAVPALCQCLKNPSPEVRFWSIASLGRSECRKVIPRLRVIAKYDRREIQEFGSIAARARQAISEIKGTYYTRSSKKFRRPIEL